MLALDPEALQGLEDSRDQCAFVASAFYGNSLTLADLPLDRQGQLECSTTSQAQSQGTITLEDSGPSLVPVNDTDPLAAMGQEIQLAYQINYGGQSWNVPMGTFRISGDPASSEFALNGHTVGWQLQVSLTDRFDILVNDSFIAATGPTPGNTVKTEVQMLCLQSGVPFVWPVATADASIPAGTVYQSGRLDAITQLLALVGCEPAMTRQGELTLRVSNSWLTSTVPVATVSGVVQLSIARSNSIYNYVVVTNPLNTAVQGIAAITDPTDPRNINGPLRRRTYANSNPLAADSGTAQAMAQTILARVSTRTPRVATVTSVPVPHLELGDFVLAIDPASGRQVTGTVTGLSVPMDPTAMWTLTLTVAEVLHG